MKLSAIIILVLLVLLLFLQSLFWAGKGGILHFWRYQEVLETSTLENTELQARNDKLKAEIFNLQNETEAIEEQARNELGLIKEGETFFHIIQDNKEENKPQEEK